MMTKFPENNITKFEQVDFVHNMTPLQLKKIILNLWLGLDEIANEYENNTPNITQTIDELKDALRNGTKWKVKKSINRFKHFKTGECILQFDNKDQTLTSYHNSIGGKLINEISNEDAETLFPNIFEE